MPINRTFWQRHRVLKWALIAFASSLVAIAALLAVIARHGEPYLRGRIVSGLEERFHARVELDAFHILLGNSLHGEWGLWAQGNGLRIWPSRQLQDAPPPPSAPSPAPLIQLNSFRFHVPLRLGFARPLHISSVHLAGLEVHIPPRKQSPQAAAGTPKHLSQPALSTGSIFGQLRVDGIQCLNAHLLIESSKPGKAPLEFAIARVLLTSIAPDGSMHFQAELTNPRPPGLIESSGAFGPWSVADPGESPVAGAYTFKHADLSVIHGIAGILSSTGRYQGVLRELTVDGETDTPDFRLTHSGNPMPLHTRFHAFVDGTNGDTDLEPVDASLGKSSFTARGKIVRVRANDAPHHYPGHDIALSVAAGNTRIEDFLRLAASGTTPLLTGNLAFNSTLHIAPGPETVQQRLELRGKFNLDQVDFSSAKVQQRIRELSLRGRGLPGQVKSDAPAPVHSAMSSSFTVTQGVISLPDLDYSVPGADIQLHGAYAIESGALNFEGKARMQATVSEMVGGWKGFLLKPADRLFRREGAGALFPVHISGTRDNPSFTVDMNRMNPTSPERPGEQPQTHPQSPAESPPQPRPEKSPSTADW